MQEAMNKVKAALGRDAIILHTRKFRKGGIGGFLGREMVEVMAAADNPNHTVGRPTQFQEDFSADEITEDFSSDNNQQFVGLGDHLEEKSNVVSINAYANTKADLKSFDAVNGAAKSTENDDLHSEVAGVKQMLELLLAKNDLKPANPLFDYLIKKDILPDYASEIVNDMPASIANKNVNSAEVKTFLSEYMDKYLHYGSGIDLEDYACKKVALVGSTGVGKTTTLAKLAARFALECGLSVAFITSDTYRIAAVEQLKTYANILNIPLEVVYSPEEMQTAIKKHEDKHLILIDTAGRSQYNTEQISELEQLLKIDNSIETHLVLSCTTKYQDAVDVVKRFSDCYSNNVIFTKIDEANNIGNIFNIMRTFSNLGISYVTNGQNVPDDIQVASTSNLTDIFLRD